MTETLSIVKFLLVAAMAVAGHSVASADGTRQDSTSVPDTTLGMDVPAPMGTTCPHETEADSPWSRNWFVSVSAGTSAFVGSPLGCEDLFGRLQPALQVAAGKWLTPSLGLRLAYQGFGLKFTDADITDHRYHHIHADLMWNVVGGNRNNELGLHRWTVAPYVGGGIIHHEDNGKTPFAISYGVMAAYRLNKRLSVNMELAGLNTFKDFDGQGARHRLGDQLYTLSAGLTVNIGKVGWKRTENANPHCRQQYERANEYVNELARQRRGRRSDSMRIAGKHVAGGGDYSGLASLKARLAHKDWNGKGSAPHDSIAGQTADGRKLIGVPFYFFFKINTTDLTDPSQLQNLVNLAKVASAYHLNVYVDGAADSATGTEEINDALSEARANYIAGLLREQGVTEDVIRITAKGGIDRFSPIERNRHTRVMVASPKE